MLCAAFTIPLTPPTAIGKLDGQGCGSLEFVVKLLRERQEESVELRI
jgi:hypothetical protein